MKGADANVVLRYLVQDEPSQARAAARVVESAAQHRQPLFVSVPVLCEIAWVLAVSYKQPRISIAAGIQALLDSAAFEIERQDSVAEALDRYRIGPAGFADYLIGIVAREHGCSHVYTFDRGLRGAPEFRVL